MDPSKARGSQSATNTASTAPKAPQVTPAVSFAVKLAKDAKVSTPRHSAVSGKATISAAIDGGLTEAQKKEALDAVALQLSRSIVQAPRPTKISIDRGETPSFDDDE